MEEMIKAGVTLGLSESVAKDLVLQTARGAGLLAAQAAERQNRPSLEERVARTLERFPQSDANRDGTLTREEAVAFFRSRRESMRRRTGRAIASRSS